MIKAIARLREISGKPGTIVEVEDDHGDAISIDLDQEVDNYVKQFKNKKMNGNQLFNLIDGDNKYFRLMPKNKGCIGRAELNQKLTDEVGKRLGLKFKKQ